MSGEERKVELYVRSSAPGIARERQRVVRERLDDLVEEGVVDRLDVHRWPKRVALDGSGPSDERALERHAEFEDWASEAGVDLEPGFDTRTCYSSITGRRYRALVLPVTCVALYEDEELSAVFPHADGGEANTVNDCLLALETDAQAAVSADREKAPVRPAD